MIWEVAMKKRILIPALFFITTAILSLSGCSKDPEEITREDIKELDNILTPIREPKQELEAEPELDPLINELVTKPEAQDKGPRSLVYFTSWSSYDRALSVKDIDPNLLTHINFAFANLTEEGEVVIGDEEHDLNKDFGTELGGGDEDRYGHMGQFKQLKEKYPHIKVLISIGGWSWSDNFSDVAADPVKRDQFAASAAEFVSKYGLDGVDIDWEYPVEGGDNIIHRVNDNDNYEMLLKATRKALNQQGSKEDKTYLLTICARATGRFILDANLIDSMQYLDFINLMTYDFHGPWERMTGFHTALYDKNKGALTIDSSVTIYSKYIDPADINLGLAFYGRGWTNIGDINDNGVKQTAQSIAGIGYGLGSWEAGVFDAWDLVDNYVGKNGYVRYYDEMAQCPYVFDGTTWIGYDDEQSIKVKTEYAMDKGLGGVFFWEFGGDRNLVLQKVISETLGLKTVQDEYN